MSAKAPRGPRRSGAAFERLVRTMAMLRAPRGCPWDRQQTHETLRPFLIEESYEAVDAIDRGALDALAGELGDVLFQCVFHAQVGAESGRFDIVDVVRAVTAKLIRRHPHVFAPSGRPLTAAAHARREARTSSRVLEQWEQIKNREQQATGRPARVLAGVPRALPALLRAHKIGARVATVGFDWTDTDSVVDKIDEEVGELRAALREGRARTMDEMGDLLFTIANLARKLAIEPEEALTRANDKFSRRFDAVEAWLEQHGATVHTATREQLEAAWNRVKHSPATRAASRAPSGRSAKREARARPSRRRPHRRRRS